MIKEKLKRGTLIYKLYLYYHLFFRYKIFYKRKNYSQFDEDIFLTEFFKKRKKVNLLIWEHFIQLDIIILTCFIKKDGVVQT